MVPWMSNRVLLSQGPLCEGGRCTPNDRLVSLGGLHIRSPIRGCPQVMPAAVETPRHVLYV